MTWCVGFGATFYSDYNFDADRTVATLRDEKITLFYPAYQPVTEAVLAHPEFDTSDIVEHPRVAERRPAGGAGQVPEPPAATPSS